MEDEVYFTMVLQKAFGEDTGVVLIVKFQDFDKIEELKGIFESCFSINGILVDLPKIGEALKDKKIEYKIKVEGSKLKFKYYLTKFGVKFFQWIYKRVGEEKYNEMYFKEIK